MAGTTLLLVWTLGCALTLIQAQDCQFGLPMNDGPGIAAVMTVSAWGKDSLRVTLPLSSGSALDDIPSALIKPPAVSVNGASGTWSCRNGSNPAGNGANWLGSVKNGNIQSDVQADGTVTITRVSDGKVVLKETSRTTATAQVSPDLVALKQVFSSTDEEMIFGFGEHKNGQLNQKGLTYDFEQCTEYRYSQGGQVCLPFIAGITPSTKAADNCLNYGLLWNMPGYGNVSFDSAATTWTAFAAAQLDYFVTVASEGSTGAQCNADISSHYVDASGHAPVLPEWAAGYWHSKNRYASQADLLAAAKEFHDREIPVDIIVIDWQHWTYMGDWTFDPHAWPDPQSMVDTIQGTYGMHIMVSVWPFSMIKSTSFQAINSSGFGVQNGTKGDSMYWPEGICRGPCYLYDPTQPEAREYVWSRVKQGYLKYGIHVFWLDASEPETTNGSPPGSHYKAGYAEKVGMTFPYFHSQTIHDGQVAEKQEPLMLLRSGWAGQQRYGGAVWSGDTHSQFEVLQKSIVSGLNIQLSGIAWWTTDIGGYSGGNPKDAEFNELIVRWFQYGATCPLFRQHGARPTEPWLLSNASYDLVIQVIKLRTSWRPYVMDAMQQVNKTGLPVQRPLWYDFPADMNTWTIEDQYMFGASLMAAPVYTYQARNRTVYFPTGSKWQHYFTNVTYAGGSNETIAAPLENFPLFKRVDGAAWPNAIEP
ncbi:uncharacterized family 31 glucosidase ORF2-like [Sycon ciliatum]|uniref:uncharacterized family 31 glucosidase ORF2-like n=1 Tax=Sycon ciliatum TaxID=27933 RepID=UPI0031F62B39